MVHIFGFVLASLACTCCGRTVHTTSKAGHILSDPIASAELNRPQSSGQVGAFAPSRLFANFLLAFNSALPGWSACPLISRSGCVKMKAAGSFPEGSPSQRVIQTPRSAGGLTRRDLGLGLGLISLACGCQPADALVYLREKPSPEKIELLKEYAKPRDIFKDEVIAKNAFKALYENGGYSSFDAYETALAPTKLKLFTELTENLPKNREAAIVELGMGPFPNAKYYPYVKGYSQGFGTPRTYPLDIIGIEPNDRYQKYASVLASEHVLQGNSVRWKRAVGEVMPMADQSVDAVVSTYGLCAVTSPEQTLSEIKRVLRPGGQFLFIENVLSETDDKYAKNQQENDDLQVRQFGYHLNRRTLEYIKAAGFSKVDSEYFELRNAPLIKPTVAGIAIA